jgi:imidazolonepropionase
MWLATTHYGMTVDEAWLGVTRHAARALASPGGVLAVGAPSDAVVWRCESPADVPYRYGADLVESRYVGGIALP